MLLVINNGCTFINTKDKQSLKNWEQVVVEENNYLGSKNNKWGLALSGGGTRSASFNIGLMAGLNEGDQLNNFDYISTVSGGSYAAFWYFSKLYYISNNKKYISDEKYLFKHLVFDEVKKGNICEGEAWQCRFQKHVKNNSAILRSTSQYMATECCEDYVDSIKQYLFPSLDMIIGGVIPNLALGWTYLDRVLHTNLNFVPYMYQTSIERNYGAFPDKSNEKGVLGEKYINMKNDWLSYLPFFDLEDFLDSGIFGNKYHTPLGQVLMSGPLYASEPLLVNRRMEEITFDHLKISIEKNNHKKPPIWIVNTTADVGENVFRWLNGWQDIPEMRKAVFEFTPFNYGNDFKGYQSSENYPDTMSKAVQLSAAALDSADPNPGEDVKGKVIKFFSPILSIGDYAQFKDDKNDFVYLTDGGHSENFGAYSLVKRGLPVIVISDAEQTEDGAVIALKKLKYELEKHGINGKKYKFVLYRSYDFENNKAGEPVLYYQDDEDAKMLLRHHDCRSDEHPNEKLKGEPLSTVLIGKICEMKDATDLNRCTDKDNEVSTVFYVKARAIYKNFKLGLDMAGTSSGDCNGYTSEKSEECYSKNLRKYLIPGDWETVDSCFTEYFPGTPTDDIFYKSYQYDANFTFGKHIGRVLANKINLFKMAESSKNKQNKD